MPYHIIFIIIIDEHCTNNNNNNNNNKLSLILYFWEYWGGLALSVKLLGGPWPLRPRGVGTYATGDGGSQDMVENGGACP